MGRDVMGRIGSNAVVRPGWFEMGRDAIGRVGSNAVVRPRWFEMGAMTWDSL